MALVATVAVDGVIVTTMPSPNSIRRGPEVTDGDPGLVTVIYPLPDCITLLVAFTCVAETNVVGNATPSSLTIAPLIKLTPLTVKVEEPSGTLLGENHWMLGVGTTWASALRCATPKQIIMRSRLAARRNDFGNCMFFSSG